MELSEIKKRKKDIENSIFRMLKEFEKDTGMDVSYISFEDDRVALTVLIPEEDEENL